MHLVKDENGHVISHAHYGEHTHEHVHADGNVHTHEHTHEGEHDHVHAHGCDCRNEKCNGSCADETAALLNYMLQHNQHHAEELDQMAKNLRKLGMEDAARTIEEGVADFQKGNMRLSLALTLVKEHQKEA